MKKDSDINWKLKQWAIIFILLLVGCTEKNLPPTAHLEITPTTGEVPLQVNFKLSGDDPDGIDDITEYKLTIGGMVTKSSTPIDVTNTFINVGTVEIYGEVTDSENQTDKTSKNIIELQQGPYIEQTASLVNENDISYSATVYKKQNAQLVIKKDGVSFMTVQITDVNSAGVDYQKTFKYSSDGITKGNYEFILKADDLEKNNSVQVPNYKPTENLSGLDTELTEGVEKTITLPTPLDKNPEDNPVSINSATSLDGKTQVTLNGNNLTIKPLTYTGDYQVQINFGSTAGGLENAVLSGSITQEPWTYYVNPFVSTNTNGVAWDGLTTKAQRDAYLQEKLADDWTDTIPGIINVWDCTEYSKQLYINFNGFTNPENYTELPQYYGDELDSLYFYHGTLKDNGKYGIPVYFASIEWGEPLGHDVGAIVTGNTNNGDITIFENWNLIESSNDKINQKPGGLSYIPKDCIIQIWAPTKDRQGNYYNIYLPILRFEIEDGIQTSYSMNSSPTTKIIRNRE